MFGQRKRLTGEFLSLEIEGLSKQGTLPQEEQEPRWGNHRRSICFKQMLRRTSVERTSVDALTWTTLDEIDEVQAVGQKLGKPMAGLSRLLLGNSRGFAACGRHLPKISSACGSEQDHSLAAPRASTSHCRVGQDLWGTADNFDAFQFAVREECYRLTVWRPEWIYRSSRSPERLGGYRIQRPDPELQLAFI